MSTCVAALYAAAGGAPATTPAQDLVDTWASGGAGSDGFAMVFEDSGGTDAPSIYVKDSGTPANDTDINLTDDFDAFNSFLTYTSPSPKIVRQSDGNLKYCAHNLYLNSASPANQSITVVSGQTYAVTITGSVSVTASGAATGTWTAGTNTFTAATTTLTLGSTSGSGTVHVYRTPADTTYLATTGSIRYALPIQHDSSNNAEGLLVEPAATNLLTYSNDLTNAAWTKANMTTAKTATGPGGSSNEATTCTATAGNATALFSITSASAARVTSAYIKRRTGTGNIDLTQNNGSTWTTVAVDSNWTRFDIGPATAANPIVGIRIVTSGDAVDVALFQHEVGSVPTSPIITTGATATRAEDQISKASTAWPQELVNGASTLYAKMAQWPVTTANATALGLMTNTTNRIQVFSSVNTVNRNYRVTGPGDDLSATGTAATSGVDYKIAFGVADNDVDIYVDGSSDATSGTADHPSSLDNIYLGRDSTVAGSSHVLVKEILYLPEKISDANLGTLTT